MSQTVAMFPSVQQRILIDCIVGLPDVINPIRGSKSVTCHGLIDTGAMASAVSKRVADYMKLPVTGSQSVITANGHTDVVDSHIINIGLGGDVRFPMVQVSCIEMDDEDLIIGMDLLCQGDMVLSNSDGKTVFLFKVEE